METRLLRMFQAIARHGSLSQAARQLHLTASALSHGLKALETQLGIRLFDRVAGRLVLNQSGEQLEAAIRTPLARLEAVAESVRGLAQWGQGRLRIGSSVSACQHLLPRVLRELRREFPRLLLEIRSGDTADLVDRLRRDEVDVLLAVEPDPAQDLAIVGLFEDELLLAMSSEHPWADGRSLSDQDLAREPLIVYRRTSLTHRLLDRYLTARGITPAAVLEVESIPAIKELVRLNLGVGILPPWVAERELTQGWLKMRPLGPHALRRRWAITRLARRTPTLPQEKFQAICRRQATAIRLGRKDLPEAGRPKG